MDDSQILILAQGLENSQGSTIEIKSTHISWVLLMDDFVYKIKKPLKLSFLDFSTLEKRKNFCERELVLNQRLTNGIYLEVLPVCQKGSTIYIRNENGQIIDYCLKMRRIDNSKEMRTMLDRDLVKESDIQKLAHQLVRFHQSTDKIKGVVNYIVLWNDFEDISRVMPFIVQHLGASRAQEVEGLLKDIHSFLKRKALRIEERDEQGFTRDCHGDLHTGNIFMLENPIIFDCIEFNDHFRQIDLLNELSFLCMDLESFDRKDLSDIFLKEYLDMYPIIKNDDDRQLFLFYKLYRCNVKVKVNAIKCMQCENDPIFKDRLLLFKRYFEMMMRFYKQLIHKELNHPLES